MGSKQGFVYILSNEVGTIFYTGVTSDLKRRVYQHKEKLVAGFTKKYGVAKLVYYKMLDTMESAILREKQIKAGSRAKKITLIESMNPTRQDLYYSL